MTRWVGLAVAPTTAHNREPRDIQVLQPDFFERSVRAILDRDPEANGFAGPRAGARHLSAENGVWSRAGLIGDVGGRLVLPCYGVRGFVLRAGKRRPKPPNHYNREQVAVAR